MPKSEKLFEMLELIKKSPSLSPKELAKRCGVSERAIYRYINTLSKVGILVSSQKGEYRLQGYYGDILSNFKPESLEAIKKLIQSGMRLYTDEKILQHGREFIRLIDANLPKTEKSEPNEIDIVPDGIRVYKRMGTITIGQSSKPSPINPILTNETISVNLLDLIFSSLIKFDSSERPIPDVARNWEISPDGLEWTFVLREDVVFHDGEALTAQDVEFTYRAILDPRNASPRAGRYDLIEDIKTDGDYIIRFKLKHPFSAFMPRLGRAIAPKHLLEGIDIHNAPFNRKPIGSGPFKMVDWNEDDTIVLEANENYFRKDRPILERLIFKKYSDTKAALEAISKGEIDVALNLAASDLLFFNENGPFRIYPVPAAAYYALVFNLKDPMFRDIRIRKAFDHAVDKESIVKEQLKGHGTICTGPFPIDSWAYNQEISPTPYNIEKAKELLKQSGWQDRDGDGILDKDGQIFEISISFTNVNDIMVRIANAISLQLSKLGIKVNIDKETNGKDKYRSFQVMLATITSGDDPEYSRISWYSNGTSNFASYKNQFVDDFMDLGRKESNVEERKKIYHKVHEIIHDDCPAIFLASAFDYIGSNYRFRTEKLHSMMYFLISMKDWQIIDKKMEKAAYKQSEKLVSVK